MAAALGAVYVVWGSTYLAIAVALESLPPLLLMAIRSIVAGAILYGIARASGAARPDRTSWGNAVLVGVLFFAIGHGLLSWAETRVPSGAAAVVVATEPLFIVLLGRCGGVLAGGARPSIPAPRVWTAVVLGLAGVFVMVAPWGAGGLNPIGVAALLIASLSWSAGTYQVAPTNSPVRAAGMQLLADGIILLLLSAAFGEVSDLSLEAVSGRSIRALAYLILFGSVITFGANVWLLPRIGPAKLSTHTFVNPLIALALGVWLGGERLGAMTLVAAAFVLLVVGLLLTSPHARTSPVEHTPLRCSRRAPPP